MKGGPREHKPALQPWQADRVREIHAQMYQLRKELKEFGISPQTQYRVLHRKGAYA